MSGELPDRLYHLALGDEWREAVARGGPYRRSTLGRSLEDEGFIHCSFADQVQMIADLIYRGRHDVVLLVLDPFRLGSEVRVEAVGGGDQRFPHIYGAVPFEAVVAVEPVPVDGDGRLLTGPLVDP